MCNGGVKVVQPTTGRFKTASSSWQLNQRKWMTRIYWYRGAQFLGIIHHMSREWNHHLPNRNGKWLILSFSVVYEVLFVALQCYICHVFNFETLNYSLKLHWGSIIIPWCSVWIKKLWCRKLVFIIATCSVSVARGFRVPPSSVVVISEEMDGAFSSFEFLCATPLFHA